jgi:hypothetical protein
MGREKIVVPAFLDAETHDIERGHGFGPPAARTPGGGSKPRRRAAYAGYRYVKGRAMAS